MSTIQNLLLELEKQQEELTNRLAKLHELEKVLQAKYQENLVKIKEQVLIDLNTTDTSYDSSKNDTLTIDIANLKLENSDIEQALNEIFKL